MCSFQRLNKSPAWTFLLHQRLWKLLRTFLEATNEVKLVHGHKRNSHFLKNGNKMNVEVKSCSLDTSKVALLCYESVSMFQTGLVCSVQKNWHQEQ